MRMLHVVRSGWICYAATCVAWWAAAMTATTPDRAPGADLADVLGFGPTQPPTVPPALLPPDAADAEKQASAVAAPPPTPAGLRFPERIVLLSGAAADDPRAFVALGEPDVETATRAGGPPDAAPAPLAATGQARPNAEEPARTETGRTVIDRGSDPLAGTPRIDPAVTGGDAEKMLARMLPPRSDTPADWVAPLEPLHFCGEPRALAPCVPPPPCHPAHPPRPFDLVGRTGTPTCGPIYRGPCEPRSATCHDGWLAPLHRTSDRLFDFFYTPR